MKILYWELEAGQLILYSEKKMDSIKLTPLEYKIFKRLKSGKLRSKTDLIVSIYDYKASSEGDSNNLKAIVWRLNKKIKPIGHIESLYGWGYKLNANIGERKNVEQ